MKKLSVLIVSVFIASLLTACAASGPASGAKVKCPACGQEFDYSSNN